jgi:hypothetical protein
MDLTSFLWGAAIGVACAFGTGFFKKAGEDCYSWAKRKINPKLAEQNPPHLIIQMNTDGTPNIAHDKVSAVTVDDIRTAISNSPPLQRDRVAEAYIGLQVEWETLFKHGTLTDKDEIRVILAVVDTKLYHSFVRCIVPAKEYRALGILPENAKVRVSGEIAEVDTSIIVLKDARLHIYGKPQ